MNHEKTLVVTVSRRFAASAERVFDAWLDPTMVAHWFAPELGEMTRVDIDPRVGGSFHLDQQRGEEIARHWGKYLEVDRPRRLAFTWCVEVDDESTVTIDITPEPDGCQVTVAHAMDAAYAEYQERTRQGWTRMLEGLNDGIAAMPRLTLVRRFTATPEEVFRCWTDLSLVRQWLFTSPESDDHHSEIDLRPGGHWTITDRRDGTDYTATGEYRVVEPPHRLVMTFAMPQFSPNSDRITVLCEPDAGGCAMTFIQEGIDIAEELRQLPDGERGGSEMGWEAMFNNLTGVLVRNRGHGVLAEMDTLCFERLLPGPIEKVWAWLTESDKRGQWFAAGAMPTKTGENFVLRFDHAALSPDKVPTPERFKSMDGGVDSHHRLLRYEPPHLLAISWGGGDEEESEVHFELREEGDGKVRLTLTHRRLVDSNTQMQTAGGWHTHLAMLEARLAGIAPPSFWTLFNGIEEEYQLQVGGAA